MTLFRKILLRLAPKDAVFFRELFRWYDIKFWWPKFWLPVRWHHNVLAKYVQYKENVFFIQVGSNNGVANDPLHHYIVSKNWDGILVEPVPYLFDELQQNYTKAHGLLQFENSAIANIDGNMHFYRLKKSDLAGLPEWYDQLGSFNKEVVYGHRSAIPHFDDLIVQDEVKTQTFDTLVKKHRIKKVDLVHIDTEGYDYEILKMIPYDSINIDLIMFEHKHLSPADYKRAIKLLKNKHFHVGMSGDDTIAVEKKIMKAMNKKN